MDTCKKFNFDGLIVFEMSKNHGGDVQHGLRIVREFSAITRETRVKGAVKLQFRNLKSYIHPQHRKDGDERMRRYFTSHLSEKAFGKIVNEIKKQGLLSMATPFDEESVDTIDRLEVDLIKVASSSAKDWPLLCRLVKSKKPVICSTGGLMIKDIDALVDFFKNSRTEFALMHCVSIYPTPREESQLNRIGIMKERYKNIPIGFSTHENPEDYDIVKMAYAKGARLFEKHVTSLNKSFSEDPSFKKVLSYTATPNQMKKWIASYRAAITLCVVEHYEAYNQN